MRILSVAIFFCISQSICGQIIKGKMYDAESTVEGVKITNLATGQKTSSGEKGDFELAASENDTLTFESIFHHPLKMRVKSTFFEDIYVFELKKLVNELDEILLSEAPKEVHFKNDVYNSELKYIIEEDIKRNPSLYTSAPKYGLDFIQIIGMVAKLFKKKKTKEELDSNASYDQINHLFEIHSFFNAELLETDLKIPKDVKLLFVEFCEARGIKKSLFSNDKKFELLEVLVGYSQQFLLILEDYNKLKQD